MSEQSDEESTVLLSTIIEVAGSRSEAKTRMKGGLQSVEYPLDQLGGHGSILAHLANVGELEHAVDVHGMHIQQRHDLVGVQTVHRRQELHLDGLVLGAVVHCEPLTRTVAGD